jgi:hypothetical protein
MDQALQERLRVLKADADALAGEQAADQPQVKQVTVKDLLTMISRGDGLPESLKKAAAEVLKVQLFEDTATSIVIPVVIANDPWQREVEVREVPIQNLDSISKQVIDTTAELVKMVEGQEHDLAKGIREAIQKGPAAEKLAEISRVLTIKIEPGADDTWEVRNKIGCLIGLLAQQAQLERVLEGEQTTVTATAKADTKSAPTTVEKTAWPMDMNSAVYDPKTRRFKSVDPEWGRDSDA